jgi:HEPN domain-containing protein
MLTRQELQKIAKARLQDAEALFLSKRYDGSIYLCGYAVEIGLKDKICKTLRWKGFPSTGSEFQNFQSFKTHNLDILLKLSGIEEKIKETFFDAWSIVTKWEPEVRYRLVGSVTKEDAELMIEATKLLLRAL